MAQTPPGNEPQSAGANSHDAGNSKRRGGLGFVATIVFVYTILGPIFGALIFIFGSILADGSRLLQMNLPPVSGILEIIFQLVLLGVLTSYVGTVGWTFITGAIAGAYYFCRSKFPLWMAIAAPLVGAIISVLVTARFALVPEPTRYGNDGLVGFQLGISFVSNLKDGTFNADRAEMLGILLGVSILSSLICWWLLVKMIKPRDQVPRDKWAEWRF